MSCRLSSGVCVLPQTSQPASLRSSLYMVPRPSSQLTSSSTRLGSPCTRKRRPRSARRRRRPAGRRPAVSTQPVRHLPAGFAPLPQPQGQAKIFPRGRPGASADPANSRPAQALGPLGRPFRHQQGTRQRLLLLDRRKKTKSTQEG